MRIIGIHDHHNASVCLLEDGKLLFALEEERLNRVKNYCGFPYLSLDLTLKANDLAIDEVDMFAFSFQHAPPIRNKQEWWNWFRSSEALETPFIEAFRQSPGFRLYKMHAMRQRMKRIRKAGIPPKKVKFLDHHLAHAAAAYYGSPYDKATDDVLVLTLDGGGDGLCGAVYLGKHGRLERIATTKDGHSIASIYAHVTFMLGMTPLEHEYKLMGLAPYAKPEYYRSAYEKLNELVRVDGLSFRRTRGPSTLYAYRTLKNLLRFERFDNICGALQRVTEEKMVAWIRNCIAETGIRNIACAGGAFMNVKANQRIAEMPECDHLFVVPSCGDESSSIGAAYEAYAESQIEVGDNPNIQPLGPIYLGPAYDEIEIQKKLLQYAENHAIRFEKAGDINATVAELLQKDKVVARFNGRLEFGARALGNRSILANPSELSNVRKINDMIKMRDFWMPFAPTILYEHEAEYVINPKKIAAPYMILTFNTTEKRRDIQAAIHPADFTARPQVLTEKHNQDYWSIIDLFSGFTGIGAVLNTSFNLHGEPMVASPEDALSTFVRSGLEYLALGDYVVRKI